MAQSNIYDDARLSFVPSMKTAILVTLLLMVIAGSGFVYLGKLRLLAMMLAIPVVLLVVTHPKLALTQFFLFLFVNKVVLYQPVILVADLSALLVIVAGVIDYFVRVDNDRSLPKYTGFLLALFGALVLSAVFGHNPLLAVNPGIRLILLLVAYWTIYRLMRYYKIMTVLRLFFWVAVGHCLLAIVPLLSGGLDERVFGLSRATLDDFLLFTIPMGLVFLLYERGIRFAVTSMGILIMFISLLATQSRLPFLFISALLLFAAIIIYRKHRMAVGVDDISWNTFQHMAKKRTSKLLISGIMLLSLLFIVKPGLLLAVGSRFESLFSLTAGDTLYIRLVIWKAAWQAFLDNPLVGLGPGQIRYLYEVYNELHFNYVYIFTKGLSAHNLTLHYLAEYGLLGATVLLGMFVTLFRQTGKAWREATADYPLSLIVYLFAAMLLLTTLIEAGWMWGQLSYLLAFLLALSSRYLADQNTKEEF